MKRKATKLLCAGIAAAMLLGSTATADAAGLRDIFDAKYYAGLYPDLKAAFGDDEEALYQHFLNYGLKEGRVMNPILDIVKYREQYADLAEAFGDNWDLYVWHFFTYGVKEHRDNGTDFNLLAYLDAYEDVADAFGTDYEAVARHYAQSGIYENRQKGSKTYIQGREEKAEADNSGAESVSESAGEAGSTESGNAGETDPDNTVVRQKPETLENGTVRVNGYNAKNQLIRESYYDTNNVLTAWKVYQYDAAGNLVIESLYDAAGKRTEYYTYEYNANGKRTKWSVYDAQDLTGYTTYEYDTAGNLAKEADYNASGTRLDYHEYNAAGNEIKRTTCNAAGKVIFDVAYIYETNIHKGYEETRYEYDENGKMTKKSCSNEIYSGEKEFKDYFYDADGNVIQEKTYGDYRRTKLLSCIESVYENGQRVSATKYEYDENGELKSTTPIL